MNFTDPFGLCKSDEKINKLGPYGDPRTTPGLSNGNINYTEYTYTDRSALAVLAQVTSGLDSGEDGNGKTGVVTYPSLASGVQNFGNITLTTFDNKSTPSLDGYVVTITLEKSAPDEYAGTVMEDAVSTFRPTVLSEEHANSVLKENGTLVDQALGEDRRTWPQKIIDFIF